MTSGPPSDGPLRAEQIVELGQFSMRSRREGDTHTVSISGEMDVANAGDVEQELMRVEATDARAIVLDLGDLQFLDSTGINMLLTTDARSRAGSNRLVLLRPPAAVQRVLQLAGIADRLPFADG